MTLRKTLIGALAALLLFAGYSSRAQAQEADTTTDTATTDTTTDDTTTDTTGTTTDGTTTSDTTTTADTATAGTTTTDTTTTDTATAGTGNAALAESFGTGTPNPQPSQPLPETEAPPENAALATEAGPVAQAAPAAAGEVQLAFTGPDVRVMALGALLLGAGAIFLVISRSQRQRLEFAETWVE